MIVDTLANGHLYVGGNGRLAAALAYLRRMDFSKIQPGRYELDGKDLYAMVQHYSSRPEQDAAFEAHRVYADVHYVFEGSERMGYEHIRRLTVTEPYDEARDCEMLQGRIESAVTLFEGMFAVVFPQDAHAPCLAVGEPAPIKKVVVKFRV